MGVHPLGNRNNNNRCHRGNHVLFQSLLHLRFWCNLLLMLHLSLQLKVLQLHLHLQILQCLLHLLHLLQLTTTWWSIWIAVIPMRGIFLIRICILSMGPMKMRGLVEFLRMCKKTNKWKEKKTYFCTDHTYYYVLGFHARKTNYTTNYFTAHCQNKQGPPSLLAVKKLFKP